MNHFTLNEEFLFFFHSNLIIFDCNQIVLNFGQVDIFGTSNFC